MRTPAAWLRACKRRKPGIYLYTTRKHLEPWKKEFGYAGKSRNLAARDKDHCGTGQWGHAEKPWMDLKVRLRTLQLPWWLGWDWLTLTLEALLIWTLRPRYNWQLNPRRDKVGPREQKLQRTVRDSMPATYRAKIRAMRITDLVIRYTGAIMIILGLGGYLWQRAGQ
jgi:hypothetical protein